MMKNLFKSLALVAMLAMASCSQEEAIIPTVTESDAISFGTFIDQATKGGIFTTEDMQTDGFGIMGYYTSQSSWNKNVTPNFMYNQQATYGDSSWSYTPVKYWSNIGGDKYSFFAYAPYGSATMSDNDATGVPTATFTINDDATKMIDFVAGQEIDVEQQEDAVKFNLKHQLTRVTFSANTEGNEETYVVVSDMQLVKGSNLYGTGTYTFDTEDTTGYEEYAEYPEADHEQDGTWSSLVKYGAAYPFGSLLATSNTSIGGYTDSAVRISAVAEGDTSLFTSGEYLFLLPPNGQTGLDADGDLEFQITYQVLTEDDQLALGYSLSDEKTAVVSFPAGSLKQGRAYNFILTITLTEVKVSAKVLDWDEEYEITGTTGYENSASSIELYTEDDITTVGLNRTIQVYAELDPENANEILSWSSSDESIATVDQDGLVTGVGAGNVTISATGTGTYTTSKAASATASIDLTVKQAASAISLVPTSAELKDAGSTTELSWSWVLEEFDYTPNSDNVTVSWESSDEDVATVTDGTVKAVAKGETTITVYVTLGSNTYTGTCDITVYEAATAYELSSSSVALHVDETSDYAVTFAWVVGDYEYAPAIPTATIANTSIATLDSDNYVTGVAAGTTTLNFTSNGTVIASCDITVENTDVASTGAVIISTPEEIFTFTYGRDYEFSYDYVVLKTGTSGFGPSSSDEYTALSIALEPEDTTDTIASVKWTITNNEYKGSGHNAPTYNYVKYTIVNNVLTVTANNDTPNGDPELTNNYVKATAEVTTTDGKTYTEVIYIKVVI